MPGLTADDWPYLESGDAPDLPLATEGLALKGQSLEERVAIIETLTADTDFVSMGGSGSPMLFAGGTSASRIVAQSGSPGIRLIGGKLAYLRGSLARFNGDPMTGPSWASPGATFKPTAPSTSSPARRSTGFPSTASGISVRKAGHPAGRQHRAERWLQRTPVALLEYPFETLIAAWGLFSGPPLLLGFARPPSINDLLPTCMVYLWACLMFLSGLTMATGLIRHTYGTTVSRGMYLLGTVCVVYAVAILTAVGPVAGIPSGPLLTVIGVLCYLRATWLRARAVILHRVSEASR
jgi:hypothetical protein